MAAGLGEAALKLVHVTVDGRVIEAEEGAPLLPAILDAGIDLPHYCFHPKLTIDGSCRLCQVKIEGMPKLQISCNTPVKDGMVVHANDDPDIARAREGVLEMLLLNHPLDCPICDKAGECWLQNYSFRVGSRRGRTVEPRRKAGKRMDIGERILLDQERCILCRRCVRFCREISKTGELVIYNLGDRSILDISDKRLDNDYSMNVADICPVGALETKDFHHKIRVWFLEETASVCPSCANGCNLMISAYKNRIWRMTPRRNDAVNDTWLCDWGRLNYKFVHDPERMRQPMVKGEGELKPSAWEDALTSAMAALLDFRERYGTAAFGAVVSPHLTNEENFRFGELLRAYGAGKIAMAVKRGKSDDFLIKAEKAANARGVRELRLVAGGDDGVEALLKAAESGEIKGLYLCGEDLLEIADPERIKRIFSGLELLIYQGLRMHGAVANASVVFPTTTFAEKEGTFTNHAGRIQLIRKALDTEADWLSDGEIFTSLLNALTGRREVFTLTEVWRALGGAPNNLSALRLENIGPRGEQLAAGK